MVKLSTGVEVYTLKSHGSNRIIVRSSKINDKTFLRLTPINQILKLLK